MKFLSHLFVYVVIASKLEWIIPYSSL
jgi:hypothetical protein